jgi:hypothetical protein
MAVLASRAWVLVDSTMLLRFDLSAAPTMRSLLPFW